MSALVSSFGSVVLVVEAVVVVSGTAADEDACNSVTTSVVSFAAAFDA